MPWFSGEVPCPKSLPSPNRPEILTKMFPAKGSNGWLDTNNCNFVGPISDPCPQSEE